jgi:DnaJ-class molecular chaperone
MSPARTEEARPATCGPCRGTGKLISGLGGTPHEVVCPWCRGTGEFIPGLDAQQSPAEDGAPGGEAAPRAEE